MSWRDHLTDEERFSLSILEKDHSLYRTYASDLGQAIARIRNTCVQRARRKK